MPRVLSGYGFLPGLCYPGPQRGQDPLTRSRCYVGTDGTKFIKTATPMCLSYHPADPLTEEEVIARARTDCWVGVGLADRLDSLDGPPAERSRNLPSRDLSPT
jgi:hypothetical protein